MTFADIDFAEIWKEAERKALDDMPPRFRAVGDMVETVHTGRLQTIERATEALAHYATDAAVCAAALAPVSQRLVSDLIAAIRNARANALSQPNQRRA